MRDLDAWFASAEEDQKDDWARWQARAHSEGPSAWRKRDNPITRALADTLCQDELIDPVAGEPAFKQVWSVASNLLVAYSGDYDLIIGALERCRKKAIWLELNLYVKRKNIELQVAKLRAARNRPSWADVAKDTDEVDQPLIIMCPRCGKMIYPEHEGLPCLMH